MMQEDGTSSTALVPASTALQPLTQIARGSLDDAMLGHLVNALDGNQPGRPMLEDRRTGASEMEVHIGPPMSMVPLMSNAAAEQHALIQAAADYQEGRDLYFADKREKKILRDNLLLPMRNQKQIGKCSAKPVTFTSTLHDLLRIRR